MVKKSFRAASFDMLNNESFASSTTMHILAVPLFSLPLLGFVMKFLSYFQMIKSLTELLAVAAFVPSSPLLA